MRKWILPLAAAAAIALGLPYVVHSVAYAQGAAISEQYDAGPADGLGSSPAVAPDPAEDPGGFFLETLRAARSKNGWMIASVIVVALSWLLRLLVRGRTSFLGWFATDRGGPVLTAIVATLGGFAHATAAGVSPGWPFLLEVAEVWLTAIGFYVALKKTLAPSDISGTSGAA